MARYTTIATEDPDLPLAQVMTEFEIETQPDLFARARVEHRAALGRGQFTS